MNKRNCIASLLLSVLALASAAGMTKDEERIHRGGGLYERPNSQRGRIVIIDLQKTLSASNVQEIVKKVLRLRQYDVIYKASGTFDCPSEMMKTNTADFVFFLLDDPKKPISLISPDERWAMVNYANIDIGLKTKDAKNKFLENRCRKQLLRLFSAGLGGWTSGYPDNISSVAKLQDLDIVKEALPYDVEGRNETYLKAIGITPRVYVTYSRACREGWAPQPTNDIQKAIWDKVHAIPQKPLKIEYNEKRDKGK